MTEYQNITQYPCRTPIHHRLHKPVMHAYPCPTNVAHPARACEKLACAVTHRYAPAHAPPAGGFFYLFPRGRHAQGFIYPTPPRSLRERAARFLKLIPIAALLAAGFAPQAWADSGGKKLTLSSDNWYIGCGAAFPCPGSDNNEANGRAVFVDSSGTHERVAGGYSDNSGSAPSGIDTSGEVKNNELTIASGGVVSLAHGGYASTSDTLAHNNTLTIKGTVNHNAYGGLSQQGAATYNQVTLAAGGKASEVYGGWAWKADATHNEVTIESGSTVSKQVKGGLANSGGNATYNTVTISGGTIGSVHGGEGTNATNNTVTLSGGTVTGSVYGGVSFGDATDNTVTLAGGTVTGSVYGGAGPGNAVSGNTLAVKGTGSSVGDSVQKFAILDFTLPADIANDGVMLTVSGAAMFEDAYPVTVNIAFDDAPTALNKGNRVKLITSTYLPKITLKETTATATTADRNYVFEVRKEGNDLIAELKKVTYTITATATPAAGGSINCDPTTVEDGSGETVTCSSTAKEGYMPDGFEVTGGPVDYSECDGELEKCVLKNIEGHVSVTAKFVKVHKVSGAESEGGKVECLEAEVADDPSIVVTCEATANDGFEFAGSMTVKGTADTPKCSGKVCTIEGIKSDITVTGSFKATGGGGGSFALGVVKIDDDTSNKNLLQPGRANVVQFTLGAPFDGSGTLDIVGGAKRALQKASPSSTTVTISGGTFTASITPEAGEKTVKVTLTVKDITVNNNPYTFTVAGSGGGGPSPVPTLGEVGLLLSGIALAGAAAPALRRREKQGKKADTHQ